MHKVYIVGAGPGAPDLLTVKARNLLHDYADVVVYDRLVPEAILGEIPDSVELIYAGKSCKKHHMTQEEINDALVSEARLGKRVVRLKGGDPFIFGRGGEEIEFLAEKAVPFEVVPGISSASGISSELGIPLTHRGVATSVRFITGHQQNGEPVVHDWGSLANPETTLVIYMGLANLELITSKLIEAGMDKATPAVAIQNGTLEGQKLCYSDVVDISKKAALQEFAAPTLIIIGRVVGIGQKIAKNVA